ncbi:MAG TPA: hypothetical protein VMN37_12035 [Gemmatimonadales bacterium]|nr:hypothetical protein [Gemmatimonadales bacterium]
MAVPSPEPEIRALLDQSVAAWNRGDLGGHLADNADSITFMTGRGPVTGKDKTGGGEPDGAGWFTTIGARGPEGWRVIHDHSS